MRKSTKILGAAAVAGLVFAAGSAFTSANTVGASAAGSGTTAIDTYTTSAIQYNANTVDPQNLDSVTFTLDKSARYVAIQTHALGTWVRSDDGASRAPLLALSVSSCTSAASAGLVWTCDVTGHSETVLAADSLTVVATS